MSAGAGAYRRRLSPSERFDFLTCRDFPNLFATTARVHGPCSVEDVQAALEATFRRHPVLRSRIRSRPFPFLPELTTHGVAAPALRVVDDAGEDDWIHAVETELQQPFPDEAGPLVRFVLLRRERGFDLVVVSSHVISDGMSHVYLIRDILTQLADPAAPVRLQESPPGWNLLAGRPGPHSGPRLGTHRPAGFHRIGPATEPFTVRAWIWDEPKSSALVRRCRAEGTTVHAALATALLRALAQLEEGTPVRRLGSPVSLRDRLPSRYREGFGCYVGPCAVVTTDVSAEPDFWAMARTFKENLTERSNPRIVRAAEWVLRALYRAPAPWVRRLIRHWLADEYDAWITNLTRLPVPVRYGGFRLEAVHLAVNTGGPRRRVIGVAEVGGRICFTAASSSGPLLDKAFERMTADLTLEVPW